jgi:ABC-2 type transport system permease protein
MRLLAEEKKQNTIQLLMTSPITLGDIVLGKFTSSFFFISTMLGITLIYPIILFATGNPEWGPIFTSYLGTLLLCSCYLAIGLLCSSMTENQIVAGALSFCVGLGFWLISWLVGFVGPVWGDFLSYLSLIGHFNPFGQGILTTNDVFYYLSFIGAGLFLTHRVLDSYRWR